MACHLCQVRLYYLFNQVPSRRCAHSNACNRQRSSTPKLSMSQGINSSIRSGNHTRSGSCACRATYRASRSKLSRRLYRSISTFYPSARARTSLTYALHRTSMRSVRSPCATCRRQGAHRDHRRRNRRVHDTYRRHTRLLLAASNGVVVIAFLRLVITTRCFEGLISNLINMFLLRNQANGTLRVNSNRSLFLGDYM